MSRNHVNFSFKLAVLFFIGTLIWYACQWIWKHDYSLNCSPIINNNRNQISVVNVFARACLFVVETKNLLVLTDSKLHSKSTKVLRHFARVRTLFQTKNSRTFQGLSRAKFWNFKDLFFIYVDEFTHRNGLTVQFFLIFRNVHAWNNAKALVTIHLYDMTWLADYLHWSFQRLKMRVRKKFKDFQGPGMKSRGFQGFSRPWKCTLKIQGFSRRVRTLLSLLRNVGHIPPLKSFHLNPLPPPPKHCCFLIANSSFFRYRHWRGRGGRWGKRGGGGVQVENVRSRPFFPNCCLTSSVLDFVCFRLQGNWINCKIPVHFWFTWLHSRDKTAMLVPKQ